MRVSLVQSDIQWADIQGNLVKFEELVSNLAGKTDLVVLPEMFTTGFCVDRMDLAEPMDGTTITSLKKWASSFKLALTGSFIATENQKYYNRAFFIKPGGETVFADKHHLFSYGGEDVVFTAGNKKLRVEYLGIKIQVLICFDIRFPSWSYNTHNSYDMLIYVANFPEKRISHWDLLLKARAVENQAYVIGLNRVGVDGAGIKYNGHSAVYDFHANAILDFHANEASVKTIKIDTEPLLHYRQKFYIPKNEII